MSSSTYIDLHNMSEVYVDILNVNTVNTDNLAAGNALIGTENVVTSTIGTLNVTQLNVTNETISGTLTANIINATTETVGTLNVTQLNATNETITGTLTANIINATTETVSGVFTATNNTTSTVSRSNTTYIQSDNGNQEYYITGTPSIVTSGYSPLHGDNSGNISFNPNTHRITTGYINATTNDLSTFNGQVQCYKGEWVSDTPSIILGTQGTVNQGVIQMWGNTTTSLLLETSSSGDFELYQKVGTTASYLMKFQPTVCNIYADCNLTTGHNYKVNGVNISLLSDLTTTATTTITHTFASPNLQSNINNLSISNGLIANNTIQLAKINTSAYSASGGANLLTQYGSAGSLNGSYYTNQSGNTVTNALVSPGTSSATLGSIVSTLNLGETGISSGVLTLEDTTIGRKGYIHQRTGTMYLDVTNSVGALINIGSGSNVNTSIRALSVSATLSANSISSVTTISGTQLTASSGTSNTTLSSAVPSLILGTTSSNDGVIKFNSTGTNYSIIQQTLTGLNIDSSVVGNNINIGTNNLLPNVTIGNSSKTTTLNGSVNFNGGSISYSSGRFNNIRKGTVSPMSHTDTIPYITTNWMPLGNTFFSTVLQKDITIRSTNSYVRITVNIPLSNWGASATNRHITICRDTTAFVYGTLSSTPLVGNNYGLYHTLPAVTYETIQFSYVDTGTLTQGSTYWYAVCARGSTANIVSPNMGNNNYAEITVEELY